MLLRQINYFCTVVKRGSFTEAAEECYISQSAISQQIQALEAELGAQLLLRENRRFSLTPAGEYFYRQGMLILDEADRLRKETVRLAGQNAHMLRVGYLKSFGAAQMRRALAEFSDAFPDIDLKITTGTHEELYFGLRDGALDVVFNDQRRVFSDLYENFCVCTAKTYIEVAIGCPLAVLDTVTLNDLKRIPCILVSSKQQQSTEQDYYQNTLGFSGSFIFTDSLAEGGVMVAANRGFMPVQDASDKPLGDIAVKRLALVQGGQTVTRNYCLFWKKDKENQCIRAFADMLKEAFN